MESNPPKILTKNSSRDILWDWYMDHIHIHIDSTYMERQNSFLSNYFFDSYRSTFMNWKRGKDQTLHYNMFILTQGWTVYDEFIWLKSVSKQQDTHWEFHMGTRANYKVISFRIVVLNLFTFLKSQAGFFLLQ